MVEEGASIIDIGGESTRPGAAAVTIDEELTRVIPIIEAIRAVSNIPISIDTSKAVVMREAVSAGANLINDVRALREPGALEAAVALNVPVCLMHMQGQPRTMQSNPIYEDVVDEVKAFLINRAKECEIAGIPAENILLDPGFGFGKTVTHNLQLIQHLDLYQGSGYSLLVGVSRKSTIGKLLGDRTVDGRLYGSLALTAFALERGADIIRTHDVGATMDVIRMYTAMKSANSDEE